MNDELYSQFLDCENTLWPKLRERLAHAVDENDKQTVKRIQQRMAALVRDTSRQEVGA